MSLTALAPAKVSDSPPGGEPGANGKQSITLQAQLDEVSCVILERKARIEVWKDNADNPKAKLKVAEESIRLAEARVRILEQAAKTLAAILKHEDAVRALLAGRGGH